MATLTDAYKLLAAWQAKWTLANPKDEVSCSVKVRQPDELGRFGAHVAVTRPRDDDYIIYGSGYSNSPVLAVTEALADFKRMAAA